MQDNDYLLRRKCFFDGYFWQEVGFTWWTASASWSPGPQTSLQLVRSLTGAALTGLQPQSFFPLKLTQEETKVVLNIISTFAYDKKGNSHISWMGSVYNNTYYREFPSQEKDFCAHPWQSPPCLCHWEDPVYHWAAPLHYKSKTQQSKYFSIFSNRHSAKLTKDWRLVQHVNFF